MSVSQKALMKFSQEIEKAENAARIRLFSKASKQYEKLAEKARELQPEIAIELQFYSILYRLLDEIEDGKDPMKTGTVSALLRLTPQIGDRRLVMALPGGRFGEFSTFRILRELKAIETMAIGLSRNDHNMLRQAVDLFMNIGDEMLIFSMYLSPLKRRITGRRAALECEGYAQVIEGARFVDEDPSAAAEYYMMAVRAFRSARLHDKEAIYQNTLIGLRVELTCWICGRRVKGASHLVWMPAQVSNYFVKLLEENKEDVRSVKPNRLVVCKPCYTAISNEALAQARKEAARVMARVQELERRLRRLESTVHTMG